MALDLLAVELGSAVVKGACRIWLQDTGVAAELSGSVADLLRNQVAGVLEHRRLVRQFDQLTDVVAEKVRPLLEREYRSLPDHERQAATEAVRDTFERAALAERELFDTDLDPVYLDRYLRRQTPEVLRGALLSQDGEALYDLLLREACAYLVEVYTQLPRFEAGGITEILRRQTLLADQVRQVLERLPDRTALGGTEGFAADYRRQVANKLDRVELFGASVSEASRSYPLSVAYISLTVQGDATSLRGQPADGPSTQVGGLHVEEALADMPRAFLRGEAGSGKTSLLQWLAVRAALRDLPGRLAVRNDMVPFYLPLRSYVDTELPGPEGFVRYTGRHLAGEMPAGWVHDLLREGRALVLIDGVDELPSRQRAAVRDWLRDLVSAYPNARYVVTSRPAAATKGWLTRQGFASLELQPMGLSDIRTFIGHWHAAVRSDTPDTAQREQLEVYERRLAEAVASHRHLRALAANPMLAALLCALHRDRRTYLPRDRMEVYEAALEMLLERRDVERAVDGDSAGLSRTEKTLLLQDLAYWLIRNGWTDVDIDRAFDRIQGVLSSLPRVTASADDVFRHLLVRSGLLREPMTGRVDFVHRTFQEYLAGRAAVASDDVGALVRNAHDDQWREVVIMAAGHARPGQRDELLRGLIDRGRTDAQHGMRIQPLAVACLENSPQLDPEVRRRVEQVATELLPPKTMEAAGALAAAGDFVLDLLAARPPVTTDEVAAAVRTAALIGAEAALGVLADLSRDGRPAVRKELLGAWRYFDPDEYARTVLANVDFTDHRLRVADESLLPALQHLRHLEGVELACRLGEVRLDFVRSLSSLRDLALHDVGTARPGPARRTPRLAPALAVRVR